jgi:carbamoyl-phosphate synthase large subunit
VTAISRLEEEITHLGIRTFGPTVAQMELLRTGGGEANPPDRLQSTYAVAAVGDGRGGVAGAAALRKVVPTRASQGSQRWVGVAAQDEGLLLAVRAFFSACSLRGPAELDIGRDETGFHVLRVEPRLPAWVQLFASYGPNLPALLVRLAQGDPVSPPVELPGGPLLVGAAWEAWMTPA